MNKKELNKYIKNIESYKNIKNQFKDFTKDELLIFIAQLQDKLKACNSILRKFAEENFYQDVMHKIPCAMLHADLEQILNLDDITKNLMKKGFYLKNHALYSVINYIEHKIDDNKQVEIEAIKRIIDFNNKYTR